MTMKFSAYQIMKKNRDLCLGGYFGFGYTSEDEDKSLKSSHLDDSVYIIMSFVNYLKGCKAILKHPTDNVGTSYFWKHRVEDYSEKVGGERHWIANGLFIAVLREMSIPEKFIYPSPNAKVPFGKSALKCLNWVHLSKWSSEKESVLQ